MASFKFYFLSALVCGVLVLGSPLETPPPTVIIDVTTGTPTEDTTTGEPITTEPTTTSTTLPPNTTTSSSTTTTTKMPPPPPPPPTPAPTPPPTPAPTPAPPKPVGPPDQGIWDFDPTKNASCIVVQFAAQLNVTYPKQNSSEVLHALVNVPANATVVNGTCNGTEQWLTISWPATENMNNSLTIVFARNDSTKSYALKNLNTTLVASIFPNITADVSVDLYHYHDVEWVTPLASSYRCTPPTELKMVSRSADATSVAATLTLSRLQEEAFRTAAGKGFSAARDCAGGDIPDAVPIAVGLALGGMVVVVLVAYLVARRRSAARGYLSM